MQRHGETTIVISTTEQADAMLRVLDAEKKAARVDDYASERKKPIKWMRCTCCGESYQGRQWWNMDLGHGLGDCCVKLCQVDPDGGENTTYGVPGVHFLIPQTEKDSPPLVEDRGEPLYGLDERLRIEWDGYVNWRGRVFEHYSGSLLEWSDKNRDEARDLIRRCEAVEARGENLTISNIWRD